MVNSKNTKKIALPEIRTQKEIDQSSRNTIGRLPLRRVGKIEKLSFLLIFAFLVMMFYIL